jgi:hypothetical protein
VQIKRIRSIKLYGRAQLKKWHKLARGVKLIGVKHDLGI